MPALAHELHVQVTPRFANAPLTFDSVTNRTGVGQVVSVTRLDFLVSDAALRRPDGTWISAPARFAYLSGRDGRTRFSLGELPAGNYDRVRFHVGLPAKENHADPATLAPDHPLHPNVNGLHWNWQGGYVFLALEGAWLRADGGRGGYSYHVANDRSLANVELPVAIDLTTNRLLHLALEVDRLWAVRHELEITEATASTHSRAGDVLADQLRDNLSEAFTVLDRASPLLARVSRPVQITLMASTATPYRLRISRFFPRPALPLDNPLTEEGVELGRELFHEPRLSRNDRQSCASCHQADAAFTDRDRAVSLGAEGQVGIRNAMPLFNLAWRNSFFWDGRAPTLRDQVLMPIENPVEMHEALTNVVRKLEKDTGKKGDKVPDATSHPRSISPPPPNYPTLFARAFGSEEITADRIARALEQFLLTQVSHNSKFDRSLDGSAELTDEEKRGFELFHTEYDPRRGQFGADCFHCHGGPLFQSQFFANNGLDALFKDAGRGGVTGKSSDEGKFAVPSLRNIARTAPYMHDGRFRTLEEVVAHYSTGVERSATLDPNLAKHPDGGVPLSAADQRALVAFLRTLTDERFGSAVGTLGFREP